MEFEITAEVATLPDRATWAPPRPPSPCTIRDDRRARQDRQKALLISEEEG